MTTSLFILLLLLIASLGLLDAIHFHIAAKEKLDKFNKNYGDIHNYLVVQRMLSYLCIFGFTTDAAIYFLPTVLIFPLIHNGVYYISREYFYSGHIKLRYFNNYAFGSTANINLEYKDRLLYFSLGILLFVFITVAKSYYFL